MIEAQGVGRRQELMAAHLCSSLAAHFTSREMYDPSPIALSFQLEEEPTTPNLCVIRVGAKG
jgi:hypothetical protein